MSYFGRKLQNGFWIRRRTRTPVKHFTIFQQLCLRKTSQGQGTHPLSHKHTEVKLYKRGGGGVFFNSCLSSVPCPPSSALFPAHFTENPSLFLVLQPSPFLLFFFSSIISLFSLFGCWDQISGFLLSVCPISAKGLSPLVYNCLPALFYQPWSFYLSSEPCKVSLHPFTPSLSHFLLFLQRHPPFFQMLRRQAVICR